MSRRPAALLLSHPGNRPFLTLSYRRRKESVISRATVLVVDNELHTRRRLYFVTSWRTTLLTWKKKTSTNNVPLICWSVTEGRGVRRGIQVQARAACNRSWTRTSALLTCSVDCVHKIKCDTPSNVDGGHRSVFVTWQCERATEVIKKWAVSWWRGFDFL